MEIWKKMYEAARAVQNGRTVSEYVQAGEVAAALADYSRLQGRMESR